MHSSTFIAFLYSSQRLFFFLYLLYGIPTAVDSCLVSQICILSNPPLVAHAVANIVPIGNIEGSLVSSIHISRLDLNSKLDYLNTK